MAGTILLTGATGNVGGELAKELARRGEPFRAMVHASHAGWLTAYPGVELVAGDFDDAGSLACALAGVDRAFLLTPSSERAEAQQLAFVDAAREAGVQHVVKLSQFAAAASSPVRFLRAHAVVERAICESGLAFTFLRPNLYMQGLLAFRATMVAHHRFFTSARDATISVIDVRDVAAVAASALLDEGHAGKSYDLTGPDALTHTQMAAMLTRAAGRPITFVNLQPEAMRVVLLCVGIPEWRVDGLIELYAHYRRGEAAAITSTVQAVTGEPARSFAEFAHDHATTFTQFITDHATAHPV